MASWQVLCLPLSWKNMGSCLQPHLLLPPLLLFLLFSLLSFSQELPGYVGTYAKARQQELRLDLLSDTQSILFFRKRTQRLGPERQDSG